MFEHGETGIMTAIRLATASNVRSFQSLVGALVTCDAGWKEQIDQDSLEDEFGRFRVWSGNLGALQKGHSSLDYRLRDSPLLSGNALKFLEELNNNLNEALAIISGARLPYEEQSKSNSDGKSEEGSDDGFFSEDDEGEDESSSSKQELVMRYEEIVDIIDNLYKLSVRIRTPTMRSRSLRVASYQPKDPETGVDVLSAYALYDQQHTTELLRGLRQAHSRVPESSDEYLVTRLARGITLRRRHLKYWKRHRDKLSIPAVIEESVAQPERCTEQTNLLNRDSTAKALLDQPFIGECRCMLVRVASLVLELTLLQCSRRHPVRRQVEQCSQAQKQHVTISRLTKSWTPNLSQAML